MTKQKEIKQEEVKEVVKEVPSVTQEQLDAIIKSNEELKKKIEMLEYASNKAQIAKWNDQHRETNLAKVKVSKYHDKYVVAWTKMLENKCEKINGNWEESLKTELIYEDDSREVVDYEIWQRNLQYIVANVISTTKDSKGNTVYEVQLPEGKVLNINVIFLN